MVLLIAELLRNLFFLLDKLLRLSLLLVELRLQIAHLFLQLQVELLLALELLLEDLLRRVVVHADASRVRIATFTILICICVVIVVVVRRIEQLLVEIFLFVVELCHLFDLSLKVVQLGNISLQHLHQVLQTIVLLIESVDVLLERLGLLCLDLLQLLRLFEHLFLLGELRLKSFDAFSTLCHRAAHFLQAGVVLLDHLLELLVRELRHVVQIESDLLGLARLRCLLRTALHTR